VYVQAACDIDMMRNEELMEEAKRRAAALGLLPPEAQHQSKNGRNL